MRQPIKPLRPMVFDAAHPYAPRQAAFSTVHKGCTVHMAHPALLPVGTAGIVGKGCGADCVLRRLAWLPRLFPYFVHGKIEVEKNNRGGITYVVLCNCTIHLSALR